MSAGSSQPPPMRPRYGSRHGEEIERRGDVTWPESRQHVLSTIERLDANDAQQAKTLQSIQVQLAVLITKVSVYSAGIALVATVAAELVIRLIAGK
jgi:hypothetical protein